MMVQYESPCMSHKGLVRIRNKVVVKGEQRESKRGTKYEK